MREHVCVCVCVDHYVPEHLFPLSLSRALYGLHLFIPNLLLFMIIADRAQHCMSFYHVYMFPTLHQSWLDGQPLEFLCTLIFKREN
jgi:hypothetical protein